MIPASKGRLKSRQPNLDHVETWLGEVGLDDDHDPDIMILRQTADELDWLDEADLADKEKIAARRSIRHALTSARKNLQRLVDRHDSVQSRRRHQRVFAGLVGESLGWIDLDLLSDGLRSEVVAYLCETHEIDLEGRAEE